MSGRKNTRVQAGLIVTEKPAENLVAFANTAGGMVVVGIDDSTRKPLGIEQPLDEEERLCSLIADSIGPRLVPDVEMITVEGKTLLVVEVS